jgi:hypothetical protein
MPLKSIQRYAYIIVLWNIQHTMLNLHNYKIHLSYESHAFDVDKQKIRVA